MNQKSERTKRHEERRVIREYVYNYLKARSCVICGEADPACLEFDHLDPTRKRFNISQAIRNRFNIKAIKREIAKCQILCANCHRKKNAEEQGWYRRFLQD